MGIISWIILGALAGWIASMIMGKNSRMGALANILVGIVGAGVGGWIASILGWGTVSGLNLYSILLAIAGSCVLLFIVGLFSRNRA